VAVSTPFWLAAPNALPLPFQEFIFIVSSEQQGSVMALVNTEPVNLEVAFPDWHAWISDAGHCWATRRAPLPASRRSAGYALIVYASTPAALRAQIAAQEAISSQYDDAAHPSARSTREGGAREL